MKSKLMDLPLFENWLRERKQLSDSSIYAYTTCIGAFLKTNPDIDDLQQYNDFLIKVAIKKRGSYYYSALRHFIDFVVQDNTLKKKILEGMIKPPSRSDFKHERKYLGADRIVDVVNLIKEEKHRIISLIQTFTGVRAGDIMRIKRGNIIPEEYMGEEVLKLIIIGKGKKRNVVYVHNEVLQGLIMDYITTNFGENEYYFLQKGKKKSRPGNIHNSFRLYQMNYRWYWEDLKQALTTAGVHRDDFATHDFRRCFARRVWEKYRDVHKLQSLLNHNDARVTLRYLDQSGMKNIHLHKEMQN